MSLIAAASGARPVLSLPGPVVGSVRGGAEYLRIEEVLLGCLDQAVNAVDALVAATTVKGTAQSEPAAMMACLVVVLGAVTRCGKDLVDVRISDPRHIAAARAVKHARGIFQSPERTSTASVVRKCQQVLAFVATLHHCLHVGTDRDVRRKLLQAWLIGDIDAVIAYARAPRPVNPQAALHAASAVQV